MDQMEQRSNSVFNDSIDPENSTTNDLVGQFPVVYNKGNKFMFVIYNYYSNITLFIPMKAINGE